MSSKLGVQNIAHTNGTNAMTISSGGVVSLTAPLASSSGGTGHSALIAFDVTKTNSGGSGSQGVIVFNHVTTNIGNAYDTSNGRFTAPVAGTYEFSHVGMGAGNTGGSGLASSVSVQMFFRKNGSSSGLTKYGRANVYTQAISYPNISSSVVLTLAQNDYIEVYYDAYYMYADAEIYNNFTGKLIGVA